MTDAPTPPRTPPWGLVLAGLGLLVTLGSSVTTLDAREVAVVTQLGAPVRTLQEPGLVFRAPWPIEDVVRFDRRSRLLQVPATEMLTKDKKNLVVEPFVVWRVQDPKLFLEAVGTPEGAETQLSDLAVSRIAASLGQREFTDLMAVRDAPVPMLSAELRADVAALARQRLGVEVVDLRLRTLGLPLQNERSIYDRMRAERLRTANQYRSEGEEKASAIRAEADRQATELLAQAEQDAATLEAQAEATAARLYAEAFAKDPELYRLLRELEAFGAIADEDTTWVVHGDRLFPEATR